MVKCKRTEHFEEDFVEKFKCDYVPLTSRFQDLTGKVFGKLTAIKLYEKVKSHSTWFVRCECGSITSKTTNQLNSGIDKCTECSFQEVSHKRSKGEKYYTDQIKKKEPRYELIDSYDQKTRTPWLWYCPDCNTPFKSTPANIINAKNKVCQCNTVRFAKWTKQLRQRQVMQICKERGLRFLGWEDDYTGAQSRVFVKCGKHKHYPIRVGNLATNFADYGCPYCHEEVRGASKLHGLETFIEKATEVHKGQFDYSEYAYKDSRTPSKITCKVCTQSFKASYDNHVNKVRGCPACKGKNQEFAYIISAQDGDTPVAVKYGIATNTLQRLTDHKRVSIFKLKLLSNWKFPDSISCKEAELEVKRTVDGNVLSSREFPSGATETTHIFNINYIEDVYKKYGGVKIDE